MDPPKVMPLFFWPPARAEVPLPLLKSFKFDGRCCLVIVRQSRCPPTWGKLFVPKSTFGESFNFGQGFSSFMNDTAQNKWFHFDLSIFSVRESWANILGSAWGVSNSQFRFDFFQMTSTVLCVSTWQVGSTLRFFEKPWGSSLGCPHQCISSLV